MSSSKGPPATASAGATAAADAVVATGAVTCGSTSTSRISAPSPLPNAFLATGDYLLSQIDISFRPFTMNVVEMDWFPMAWRFRQAHVPRDHGLKYLGPEKAAQVRSDLPGESGSFVIHRQNDPFDREVGLQRPPNSHQCVKQLGDSFES